MPTISASEIKATSEETNKAEVKTLQEDLKERMDEEYFDNRTITISLINNISFFRRANDKTLDKRNEYIGSCVRSSRTLSANKDEVNAYFPNLIGVSPSNENYITRVKEYLNNIQVRVDELGKTINIGFHYKHKSDYLKFKAREEAIDAKFLNADRSDIKKLKKAIENKIVELNALESEKHKYGYPDNVADYLLYRHCILYNDVAKDLSIINSDKSVRFYFKDDQKEEQLQLKRRQELNNAKRNYVSLIGNEALFEAVYIQYCVIKGMPIISSLKESELIKQNNLDRFSIEEPIKFNKIYNDKDIAIKAVIEQLIANGIFIKHPHSQNIVTPEGDFIGANMQEAVAYFKNPENTNAVDAYKNKLKFV